jgi:DNA-binding protein HU-beta
MRQGDKVNISGFGTFSVSSRKARTGRNPKTGESIEISASRAAKFKAGKTLKDSLN